jgi:hypothetical protein
VSKMDKLNMAGRPALPRGRTTLPPLPSLTTPLYVVQLKTTARRRRRKPLACPGSRAAVEIEATQSPGT